MRIMWFKRLHGIQWESFSENDGDRDEAKEIDKVDNQPRHKKPSSAASSACTHHDKK